MTHPTVAEAKNLYQDITHDRPAAAGPWNPERLRSELATYITAYRDMAILAGEWPCKCGHQEHIRRLGAGYCVEARGCPCPEYRPESL